MRKNFVFAGSGATPIVADFNGTPFSILGGAYVLGLFGTLGGGTLKVQFATDADVTWFDVGPQNTVATQLAAAGMTSFKLPPGRYRVVLSGSAAASITYWFGEANESS